MTEWKEYKLGEIAEITSSKRIFYSEYVPNGIPFYRSKEIIDLYNKRDVATELYISRERYNEIRDKFGVPQKDDILLTSVGSLGIPYKVKDEDCFYFKDGNLTWFKDINTSIILPDYFVFWLTSCIGKQKLDEITIGSTQAALTISGLKTVVIELPPLPEQIRIASILSSLDDKIDLLHRENKTLEAMAETLFKELVVNENNDGTLENIISIQNGYAFKSKDFKETGEHQIIKIKNISSGIIDIDSTDCVDSDVIVDVSTKFKVNSGDVLIAMTGAEIGKLGVIPKNDKSLWLNQRVGLLVEKYKGAKYLAYLQLKSEYGQDYIENTATGSAQPNISGTGIEQCGFPILDEEIIIQISKQIGEFYDKIILNLGQINKVKEIRDNLLNKLMSNEINI